MKQLICLDYGVNGLSPSGRPGMTISAHAAMAALDGRKWGRVLSAMLGRIETDHCVLALVGDANRAIDVLNETWRYLPTSERQRIVRELEGVLCP